MIATKRQFSALILTLLFIFGFASASFAEGKKVLAVVGSHQFIQANANDLAEMTEFLAGVSLTDLDKKALQVWSIGDFKEAPKVSANFYQNLSKVILPRIRKSNLNSIYRAELYLNYVDVFAQHPEYAKVPNNLLAIIDRYKPPVEAAMQIRRIRNNLVMQQLQMNQMLFNQSMKQQQQSVKAIAKSIEDQSTRSAITIPGGKILHETDGRIYAEDYKGEKFDIAK